MEPLDDVVPEGMGHHDQDQHRLEPDDPHEELAQVVAVLPADMEQRHHAPTKTRRSAALRLVLAAPDPLDEEGAGQGQTPPAEGVGHEDPEGQRPAPASARPMTACPATAKPGDRGHRHEAAQTDGRQRAASWPATGRNRRRTTRSWGQPDPAHGGDALWLIGLGTPVGCVRQAYLSRTRCSGCRRRFVPQARTGTVSTLVVHCLTPSVRRSPAGHRADGPRTGSRNGYGQRRRTASTSTSEAPTGRVAGSASLVVCSLEPWGEVRRRIRILVDEIVDLDPTLRVLYVAPATDIPHRLRQRTAVGRLAGPRLEQVHPRIHVLRPRKWLPRVLGGVRRPLAGAPGPRRRRGARPPAIRSLWVNDAGYARFAVRTGWPTLTTSPTTGSWLLSAPRALAPTGGRRGPAPRPGRSRGGLLTRPGPDPGRPPGGRPHPQRGGRRAVPDAAPASGRRSRTAPVAVYVGTLAHRAARRAA